MVKTVMPYQAEDIAALARALKREIDSRQKPPGHVEWLNILVRAAGFRNYQHFKAVGQAGAAAGEAAAPQAPAPVLPQQEPEPDFDPCRVEAAARCFDADGRLLRWPAKTSLQALCLWRLWSAFPADAALDERQVNAWLKARHGFGDHALLRRDMIDRRLLARNRDGSVYRRVERRPPPEALALIRIGQASAAPPSRGTA